MIFPLAFITVCCFVIGVALLYSGYMSIPRGGGASSEELEKSNQDLKAAKEESDKLRQQLADLNKQHEEIKGKLSWAEENIKVLEDMQNQATQEPQKDDNAEKDLQFLQQKADQLARESIEVITRLAAENDQLTTQLSKPSVNPEELTKLSDENQKYKIQVEGYVNKVKELEEQIASGSKVNEQLAQVTLERDQLKATNKTLEEKLSAPQPHPAEEELKKLRAQSEEKIVQANAALTKLYTDMESLKSQITEREEKIKTLMSEKSSEPSPAALAGWEQDKMTLQSRLAELKEQNAELKEKEKILSLKLIQSRAQVLGLEKMCEDVMAHVK